MINSSRVRPLFRALMLLLMFGLLMIIISWFFFPFISPWEFAFYYAAGLAIVFVLFALGVLIGSVCRKMRRWIKFEIW